jgi:hypothetical protein
MRKTPWSVQTFVGVLVCSLITVPARAQERSASAGEQVPVPAAGPVTTAEVPKRYTVTVGVDFATSYLFRGIHQESSGFVAQPPLDLGVTVGNGVSLNVGHWYSVHSGPTGNFYEADYYGSITFTAGRLKPGVLFTSYTSPNDTFGTVHELAAFLAFDDSANAFPLSPKATLAFELDGQADGGLNRGTYLELAIKPSVALLDGATPLNLAMPARLGLSLDDYYEGINGSDTFGFFSTGVIASVPVAAGKVTWDFHGGVDVAWLGDNTKALNGNNRVKPVGILGLTLTY